MNKRKIKKLIKLSFSNTIKRLDRQIWILENYEHLNSNNKRYIKRFNK